jgi:serine protease Do
MIGSWLIHCPRFALALTRERAPSAICSLSARFGGEGRVRGFCWFGPQFAALIAACILLPHASTWAIPQDPPPATTSGEMQSNPNAWLSRAVEFAQRRMVKVYGAGAGRVNSYATGMIVSPEGHIVTMQGVFLDGDQVRVALPDGQLVTAGVVRRDRQFQLALLQTSVATPDFFELSDELVGNKGDWVVALSNAFMVAEREEPMSATLGIISLVTSIEARLNKDNVAYNGELVLIDAITSNPGAGGGAVVLPDGRLVGMIGKVINSSDTNTRINYAVPSRILKRFVAGEPLSESTPAVVSNDQQPALGFELFKHGGKGGPAYVDRVLPDGPAAAAGLKPDDLIVSLGGEKIGSIRDYDRVLPTLTVGSESILVVKRGQELLRLPITPVAQK